MIVSKAKINHPKIKKTIYFPQNINEVKGQIAEIFDIGCYNPRIDRKDLIVVDAGANVGMATFYFKDMAKHVYAIEPNPDIFYCLKKNVGMYKNVSCHNLGLHGYNGEATLSSENEDDVQQMMVTQNKLNPIKARVQTIKTFMEEQGIDHIDVLKIDIEGSEFYVFSSNDFIDVAGKIDTIVGEGHNCGSASPVYIPVMLQEVGFKTEWLPNLNYATTLEIGVGGYVRQYVAYLNTLFIAKHEH
jgi:FkbM family methyltransferase